MSDLSAVSLISGLSSVGDSLDEVSSVVPTRQYLVGDAQGAGPTQSGFADTMAQVVRDTAGDLKAAEATSIAAVRGDVSAQRVVEAVMQAELSLKSAVSVRDKVVEAYQEFARMSI